MKRTMEGEEEEKHNVFTKGFVISPRHCPRENCFSCKQSCQRFDNSANNLKHGLVLIDCNCDCDKKFVYGFLIHKAGDDRKLQHMSKKMEVLEETKILKEILVQQKPQGRDEYSFKALQCLLKVICQSCKRLFTRHLTYLFPTEIIVSYKRDTWEEVLHRIEKLVDPINNPYIHRDAKLEQDVISGWSDTTKELIYCCGTIEGQSIFVPQVELIILISNFIWMFELVAELVYYKSRLNQKD